MRTSGVSGPVDWRTTDFEWHPEAFGEQVYTFTLLLRETQGRDLTFTPVGRCPLQCHRQSAGPLAAHRAVALTGAWGSGDPAGLAPPVSLCAVLGLGARAHAGVAPDSAWDGAGRSAGPAGPGPAFLTFPTSCARTDAPARPKEPVPRPQCRPAMLSGTHAAVSGIKQASVCSCIDERTTVAGASGGASVCADGAGRRGCAGSS